MNKDTGSPQVQITNLSSRLERVQKHLKQNPKDRDSRKGLVLIMQRKVRMQRYMEKYMLPKQNDKR